MRTFSYFVSISALNFDKNSLFETQFLSFLGVQMFIDYIKRHPKRRENCFQYRFSPYHSETLKKFTNYT